MARSPESFRVAKIVSDTELLLGEEEGTLTIMCHCYHVYSCFVVYSRVGEPSPAAATFQKQWVNYEGQTFV